MYSPLVMVPHLESDVLEQSVLQHRLHLAVHLHREVKVHITVVGACPREDGGHDPMSTRVPDLVLVNGGRGQCTCLLTHYEILDDPVWQLIYNTVKDTSYKHYSVQRVLVYHLQCTLF